MYKEILQHIDNIQVWPVVSFVIFFLFFLVLLWWVITVDRTFIRHMGDIPLDDGTIPTKTSTPSSL